jgi:formate/nitrite transporter FocA (FNT family)
MGSPPLAPARGRFRAAAAGAAVVLTLAGSVVATSYDHPGTAVLAGTLSFTLALAAVAVVGALSPSRCRETGWGGCC